MSEWKKVKIGDFLTEREGRYKPDDKLILKYQRLDKIDFSGTIHISNKPTKTDMILVYPGDLVISGINVAKGAITVYQGNEPVCATIHYSAYTFDDSKVDLDYFKLFVKRPAFVETLKQQVKGGIKTEIKPKHLLPLEISIPELSAQKQIAKTLSTKLANAQNLSSEIEKQKSYAKQLRQNILQDAIEGKLTSDFRQKNQHNTKTVTSNQKNHDKKLNSLHPISREEIPFNIPDIWEWVRLGMIIESAPRNGYSPKAVDFETPIKTLKLGAVTSGIFDSTECKYINEEIPQDAYYWLKNGDILIERSNSLEYVGMSAIYTGNDNEFIYPDLLMRFRVSNETLTEYVHKALIAPFNRSYFMSKAKGDQKSMPKINQECVINTLIPLPPIAEQKEIIQLVKKYLTSIDLLDSEIQERKTYTKQLMQSILKDAFEEE
ncbi:MAG: restriction endonuclease subunit S [Treponema sp.]|nr:restriction endonuclease subunit S [Treponema sp.]